MQTVNESGLYSLILRSRKPEAKAVRDYCKHPETLKKNDSFGLNITPRGLPNMWKACGGINHKKASIWINSIEEPGIYDEVNEIEEGRNLDLLKSNNTCLRNRFGKQKLAATVTPSPTHVQTPELGTYEGHVIKVNDGMLNLTNMWRSCGGDDNRKPQKWMRQLDAQKLVIALLERDISKGDSKSTLTRIEKGRFGGTFAHPVIGLAYAKYLSPEFHIWCNEKLLESGLMEVSEGELLVKLGQDGLPVEQSGLPADVQAYIANLETTLATLNSKVDVMALGSRWPWTKSILPEILAIKA